MPRPYPASRFAQGQIYSYPSPKHVVFPRLDLIDFFNAHHPAHLQGFEIYSKCVWPKMRDGLTEAHIRCDINSLPLALIKHGMQFKYFMA